MHEQNPLMSLQHVASPSRTVADEVVVNMRIVNLVIHVGIQYNIAGLFHHLTGVKAQRDKTVPFTVPLIHDKAVIGALMMCSGFRAELDLSLHSVQREEL